MLQSDDREIVREFLRRKPFLERWLPVSFELMAYLGATFIPTERQKPLPDYCYNIFAIFRKTYFKGFPTFAETVSVTDQEGLPKAKTIEAAKKVLNINWRCLGRLVGMGIRSMRFFDLEAESMLNIDELSNLTPKEEKEFAEMFMGKHWGKFLEDFCKSQNLPVALKRVSKSAVAKFRKAATGVSPDLHQLAYQWGPEAMAEFNAGIAEGMRSVLDEGGQLAGESVRANIYNFLLMAWPEIKAMMEAKPRKTLTDLYEWMKPFMRRGVVAEIDLDSFRDVCAAPSQAGIGLKLRPLSSRRVLASA